MRVFGLKITEDKELECSLCGKKEIEVRKMLAGPARGKLLRFVMNVLKLPQM